MPPPPLPRPLTNSSLGSPSRPSACPCPGGGAPTVCLGVHGSLRRLASLASRPRRCSRSTASSRGSAGAAEPRCCAAHAAEDSAPEAPPTPPPSPPCGASPPIRCLGPPQAPDCGIRGDGGGHMRGWKDADALMKGVAVPTTPPPPRSPPSRARVTVSVPSFASQRSVRAVPGARSWSACGGGGLPLPGWPWGGARARIGKERPVWSV